MLRSSGDGRVIRASARKLGSIVLLGQVCAAQDAQRML